MCIAVCLSQVTSNRSHIKKIKYLFYGEISRQDSNNISSYKKELVHYNEQVLTTSTLDVLITPAFTS